ncbi:hypothetical protein [Catellatospora tritici]|uniref:hypothetical protein n=1 Tax=Catellatospora tritici TaxID=2851566 RepID=UPI001C2CF325|nr:hypothetical protein [Catellatospora tritici]MBV1849601.1 hypothetical protein [Catellatospora tritici]
MSATDPMPTYERFLRAAELLGMSPQELATRLTSSAPVAENSSTGADSSEPAEDVQLYAKYLGARVEAVYEPSTGHLRITSGPLTGKSFTSASRAAIAVVESVNPAREAANTNGRLFWTVSATGQPLRSILGRR